MFAKPFFNFHSYLNDVVSCNRYAQQEKFYPCACSGINYLEDMLDKMRQHPAFVCVSDVTEDSLKQVSGGWFKRRLFTVFVIKRYNTRSMSSYKDAMAACREVTRQIHTRLLHDEQELSHRLAYIDVSDIRSRELGGQFLDGATGLYFMLAMDEPADLQYDSEEWYAHTFDNTFDKYFR